MSSVRCLNHYALTVGGMTVTSTERQKGYAHDNDANRCMRLAPLLSREFVV